MKHYIEINGRQIGYGLPVYIIAEMSANHNRDYNEAVKILKAAKEAGADAIKLQTYTADTLTIECDNEFFRIEDTLWKGRFLYDLYGEAYTPWEWMPKLKEIADGLELDIFSSAFDTSSVDFLEEMNIPAYKVASFEIVDIPLIEKIAHTGKPLILSTGMATSEEIDDAVRTARNSGSKEIALLKCTSAYPAPPEEMNLKTITDLMGTFKIPVGLSDHTLGIEIPVAAVALEACIIEKHFTLSREIPGPDSAFSLEPEEFKAMVDAVRKTEQALGSVHYGPGKQESKSSVFRRSLFVVEDMKAGDIFTDSNVRSIRPGHGLAPKFFKDIINCTASRDILRGSPLQWDLVAKQKDVKMKEKDEKHE